LDDKAALLKTKAAYDSLTDEQRADISDYFLNKLEDLLLILSELEAGGGNGDNGNNSGEDENDNAKTGVEGTAAAAVMLFALSSAALVFTVRRKTGCKKQN
jgi:hypothetical protein